MKITLSDGDGVATIFLDPSKKFKEVCRELDTFFANALNRQLRAIVICDFDENEFGLPRSQDSNAPKLKAITDQIKHLPIPVITSVKNNVSSSGFEVVRASHICVASERSTFDSKFSKPIAAQLLNQGLINRVVKKELLNRETDKFVAQILELAPIAIGSCLKAVSGGLETNLLDGLAIETRLFCEIFSSQDMKEGTSAFLEKRKPNFVGK